MSRDRIRTLLSAAGLALAALVLFLPATAYPFIQVYDDPLYVSQNQHVLAGLTWPGVRWAFTSTEAANWLPVTWLSHMLDVEVFGPDPRGHHLVNVLLHAANTGLVFLALVAMTGARWRSAFVAALFAAHPLRVESVAWIAERKDVLSAFFVLLTILAYVAYTRRPGSGRYLAVVGGHALALMSKPMAVTLPALLLLLDAWPLDRFRNGSDVRRRAGWLLAEKVPLLGLSALATAATMVAQIEGGTLAMLAPAPAATRMANAGAAYAGYLWKTVWPTRLAVFYPYADRGPGTWELLAATLVLSLGTAAAIILRRRRPYALVGWLWYLVALIPVIGLVQYGSHAMADRYTYLALVGCFVVVVWGAHDAFGHTPAGRRLLAGLGCAALAVLAVLTSLQLRHWRSSEALFSHAVEVTDGNWIAHHNLGFALAKAGRFDEAARHHAEAIRLRPDYAEAYKFYAALGAALEETGRWDEAIAAYREVLRREPCHPQATNDIGIALGRKGDLAGAIAHYERAIRIFPRDPRLRMNLAVVLDWTGRRAEAVARLREARDLAPDDPDIRALLERSAGTPAGL